MVFTKDSPVVKSIPKNAFVLPFALQSEERAFQAKGRVCAKAKRPERASCVLGTRSKLALLKHNVLRGEVWRRQQTPGDTRQSAACE